MGKTRYRLSLTAGELEIGVKELISLVHLNGTMSEDCSAFLRDYIEENV
jgi:hypothetical protein